MSYGTEPIEDTELLFRRVRLDLYDATRDSKLSPHAFRPVESDSQGLSIYRAKYISAENTARNDRGKRYFIAVLRAGDLRAKGIEVVPRPSQEDPGHAELPGLRYENRREVHAEEWQEVLANELCLRVEGPFPPLNSPVG